MRPPLREALVLPAIFIALSMSIGTAAAPFTHITIKNFAPSRTKKVFSCGETGLCKKGEQRLLFQASAAWTPDALKAAFAKGCKAAKNTKLRTSITCPEGVTIPNSQPDRVFQLNDLVSNSQVGANVAQQSGVLGNGVLVAILDTGIDANHPELIGRLSMFHNFTTSPDPDSFGHGTHVAGIIAGQGVTADAGGNRALGVAPAAQLIIGKVCNDQGYCLESDIDAGIEWAVQNHARVINMSFGGGSYTSTCDNDLLSQEVNWAVTQGVTVIAATGNSGDSGEGVALPGCASKAIAVGAVDSINYHPTWSSFGQLVSLVAPGVNILSAVPCAVANTCPSAGYGQWSGTSMATPHVTGAVALLLQARPSLTPANIKAILTGTATDLGAPGFDTLNGYGLLNVSAALQTLASSSSSSATSSSIVSSISSSSSVSSNSSISSTSSISSSSSSSASTSSSSSSTWTSSASSAISSTSSNSSISSNSSSSSSESSPSFTRPEPPRKDMPPPPPPRELPREPKDDRGPDMRSRDDLPECTADAWKCSDYTECNYNGFQVRWCAPVDMRCRKPEAVRPELWQKCTPQKSENERRLEQRNKQPFKDWKASLIR